MTTPNRLALSRTEDTQVIPGGSVALYWTGETADTGGTHGTGGKTILINGQYSGVVNVWLTGLAEGETFDVYASEEDDNGVMVAYSYPHTIYGNGLPQRVSVPMSGFTANRLVIRVRANGLTIPVLVEARLAMQTWPAA